MAEMKLAETLKTLRYFEGVTEPELHKLAAVTKVEEHAAGDILFREGDEESRIYVVVEGSVGLEMRVPREGYRRIQTVTRGELLGWSPLFGHFPMTASARTLEPTRLVVLEASDVLALCQKDHQLGFTLMRQTARALAIRLSATRLHLLDVYRHELPLIPAEVYEGAD